jgi:ferric-dicitrate binding protein FerR (iron transport regulator)
MDENLLHKFFEGKALSEEKKAVKRWLDESDERYQKLVEERAFFDALLLSDDEKAACEPIVSPRSPRRTWLRELLKVAAVVAIMCLTGAYFYSLKMDELRVATYTLTVPAGQRANLQLPDGTNVWLNARSRITYPGSFSASTREITLDGEAYFDVKHDRKKPFIVHTDRYDIHVLGTVFDVEAYAGAETFSTALIKGAVNIQSRNDPNRMVRLLPNQQAKEEDGRLTTSSIDDFDVYRWREGLICFKNTDFLTLMTHFEKCYGICITVQNENVAAKVFSGKFRISDGVDNALRVLQKESSFTFERDEDLTSIYIK